MICGGKLAMGVTATGRTCIMLLIVPDIVAHVSARFVPSALLLQTDKILMYMAQVKLICLLHDLCLPDSFTRVVLS